MGDADAFIRAYNPYVCCVWFLTWVGIVALSRYSRHRAKHGDVSWSKFVLLPAYEVNMVAYSHMSP